jgi:tRNA uridine 5-carboxymethylaminomethyl modification enzyme
LIVRQCSGRIKSLGPRYCPSIEDKINRLLTRERHQLFVEPEGWNTCEVYVNGFSTSLPDIQFKALSSVAGFEKVKSFVQVMQSNMIIPPTQLKHTLKQSLLKDCIAGQINGTTVMKKPKD